jgi:hypothetical protein
MALQNNIEYKGIVVEGSYIRINRFEGNKGTINFIVTYHKDSQSQPFNFKEFECSNNLNSGNIIEQGYMHLKTLPEFADAVDC